MIVFFTEDIDFKLQEIRKVKNWISTIINSHQKKRGDINYIFCSNPYILQINKEYLNHDYFTDIITFNNNEGNKISGDIFISIDTVRDNAEEYKVVFEIELRRVMIHGILHLIGFDDKHDDQKIVMRQKEDEALNIF